MKCQNDCYLVNENYFDYSKAGSAHLSPICHVLTSSKDIYVKQWHIIKHMEIFFLFCTF